MTPICSSSLHERQTQTYFKLLWRYKGIFRALFSFETSSECRCWYRFLPYWACLSLADRLPSESFIRWLRTARTGLGKQTVPQIKLKIKQCDLQFFSKKLKFMPHFTNVTKCLQNCKILWLLSLHFMVNKCASTNYLGSCSYPISWPFWWKVHIQQKNKKICKLFNCCSLWMIHLQTSPPSWFSTRGISKIDSFPLQLPISIYYYFFLSP